MALTAAVKEKLLWAVVGALSWYVGANIVMPSQVDARVRELDSRVAAAESELQAARVALASITAQIDRVDSRTVAMRRDLQWLVRSMGGPQPDGESQ